MGKNYFEMIRDGILVDGSGGGDAPTPVLITKSVTANGTYSAADDEADGYSTVSVSVPNSYSAGDEGKVVSNGALVSQTSDTATQNGEYDTTLIDSLTVDVEGGEATLTTKSITVNGTYAASGDNADGYSSVTVAVENSYTAQDEGKVVSSGALVAQSTHKQISANGTGIDTTNYSSVDVEVPNSYSAGDEGKVVSSGTLVSQTTDSTATNGIVDTTTISSLTVNVPNTYVAGDEGKVVQSGALVSQTATSTTTNGTVDTTTNNSIVVNVANSYSAGDEGKVVSNGALVAQGSDEVTTNGTVDTTLISSLLVNVSGGAFVQEAKLNLTETSTQITYSDTYLVETDSLFILISTMSASTVTGANFIVPLSFDMSKLGTYLAGRRTPHSGSSGGNINQFSYNSQTREIETSNIQTALYTYIWMYNKST